MTNNPYIIILTIFGGVIAQCLNLLRKKPEKKLIYGFLAVCSIYLAFFVWGSLKETPSTFPEIIFSFSCLFLFFFIAIFLKNIVLQVNHAMLLSLTVSFLMLFFNHPASIFSKLIYLLLFIFIIGPYILLMRIGSKRQISVFRNTVGYPDNTKTTSNQPNNSPWYVKYKFLIYYVYFLLLNGILIGHYLEVMGNESLLSFINSGMRSIHQISLIDAFTTGMLAVYAALNGGLLYYGSMIILSSKTNMEDASDYIEKNLFKQEDLSKIDIVRIIVIQILLFMVFRFVSNLAGFRFIFSWILLMPLFLKIYLKLKVLFKKISIIGKKLPGN